jgi:hypothetical protein
MIPKVTERNTAMTLGLSQRPTMNAMNEEKHPSSKRRSMRVTIGFPVIVIGQDWTGKIVSENSKTVTFNAHGALGSLKTKIDPRKQVFLTNTKTGSEVQCRVVFQKDAKNNEFEAPHPRFGV